MFLRSRLDDGEQSILDFIDDVGLYVIGFLYLAAAHERPFIIFYILAMRSLALAYCYTMIHWSRRRRQFYVDDVQHGMGIPTSGRRYRRSSILWLDRSLDSDRTDIHDLL